MPANSAAPLSPEATVQLLDRAKGGDREALEKLIARCLPPLIRWAHRRLPQSARGMQETVDLVQDAVMASLRNLQGFEVRHQGALQAYFRQCIVNRIRDILRQQQRRPPPTELPEQLLDEATSPLDRAIGAENLARYEAALQRLKPADREAIVARIELQYTNEELALLLGKPTPDAARVAVSRAMKRLLDELRRPDC